jgi:hypothetical protein
MLVARAVNMESHISSWKLSLVVLKVVIIIALLVKR